MCLLVDRSRSDRPTGPKIFYKAILKRGRGSLYFNTPYEPGAVIKASGVLWSDETKNSGPINAGAIHVYTSKLTALHRAALYTAMTESRVPTMVIRVECLPEHFIAWGVGEEAAYTQVRVLT